MEYLKVMGSTLVVGRLVLVAIAPMLTATVVTGE